MAELRFHKSLYTETAVRQAVEAFGRLALLTLEDHGHCLAVRIGSPHPRFADRLEDELANYALQATILARGVA